MTLLLLPTPRRLTPTAASVPAPSVYGVSGAPAGLIAVTLGERGRPVALDSATVRCTLSAEIAEDEGYRLEIGPALPIRLTARTISGLRHALTTLAQIIRQCPVQLPGLTIDDAPAFAVRGAMLDISRDRVPTMAALADLVEHLAAWKINHLQLYTEHTFAYRGHEAVWASSSPMTPDEMRDLDRRCSAHGIALTANQNCLGHFERWLKVPAYAHLGERASGHMAFGHWYVDPNTLAATDPEGLALVKDLLDQLIPTCAGEYVHIGCDEPFDLGSGRSQELVAAQGMHAVYARHVSQVAGFVRAHGKRPLYWSDAEHARPEIAAALPADIVPLVWGYGPDTEFAARGRLFRERGMETWVCPGTNCWGSFTGRTWERRGNLKAAAEQGRAIGATGVLMTAWGDNGHRQQWPLTMAGFADAAQASWSGEANFDDQALGLHAFGDAGLGRWLIELGDADLPARRLGSGVFQDSQLTIFDPHQPGDVPLWRGIEQTLGRLRASLPGAPGLVRDECAHAVAIACWGASRALLRRSQPTLEARKGCAAVLAELLAEHRRLWLARSRYGGLEQSSQHYRTLLAHY
jgi:hexosaminidase